MNELVEKFDVSFVLPAFNEGELIEDVLQQLDSTVNGDGLRYEVVVIDDGSVDCTRVKAAKYASKNWHVRVFGYDKNIGKGFAVKTGFLSASGDAVAFIDSDLGVDVGQVKRFIEALKRGDIVVGSKWHKDSVVKAPIIRKLLSRGFNVLVKVLTGVRINDTQTGIKAVRREVFDDVFRRLLVKRYAFDVELLVLAKIRDLRVVELPVKLRIDGQFSLKEAWRMFLDLLGIAYRLRVRKWYQRGSDF